MKLSKRRVAIKRNKLVEGLSKGLSITDASKLAGYNKYYASGLLKKSSMVQALERVGLSDDVLADTIKTNIETGVGVKSTADTATKNVELALRLKGYMNDEKPQGNVNIQINQYKELSDEELQARLASLNTEVQELKEV